MTVHHPRSLTFPHLAREIGGPVAAGANIYWTPPARTHVLVDSVMIRFQTSAVAGTRRLILGIETPTEPDVRIFSQATQIAGNIYLYWFLPNTGISGASAVSNRVYTTLPWPIVFATPFGITTNVDNMDAGDQFLNYRIRYRMWQDPVYPL